MLYDRYKYSDWLAKHFQPTLVLKEAFLVKNVMNIILLVPSVEEGM